MPKFLKMTIRLQNIRTIALIKCNDNSKSVIFRFLEFTKPNTMFKKVIPISLAFIFCLALSTDADAQKKRSKKRKSRDKTENEERSRSSRDRGYQEETISFADRINYDINIGNIGFNQGFQLSAKPSAGYKFTDRVSAGLGLRFFYQFINFTNGTPDQSPILLWTVLIWKV